MIRKILDFFRTPSNSIFRIVDRPTCRVKTEIRDGNNWLITYIVCDVCKKEANLCEFDHKTRKWKCDDCLGV